MIKKKKNKRRDIVGIIREGNLVLTRRKMCWQIKKFLSGSREEHWKRRGNREIFIYEKKRKRRMKGKRRQSNIVGINDVRRKFPPDEKGKSIISYEAPK